MEVKLIDFIFFTFRISIIVVKEKKSNLSPEIPFLNNGYESLVLVDGRKRKKLETINTLMTKFIKETRGLYPYYGLFASLDQDNIIKSVITGIKQQYKSEKIKSQEPYKISSNDYTVNKISAEIIRSFIQARKIYGSMAFYSIL